MLLIRLPFYAYGSASPVGLSRPARRIDRQDAARRRGIGLLDRTDERRDVVSAEAVDIPKVALTADQDAIAEVV